jgi:hypothetical protein
MMATAAAAAAAAVNSAYVSVSNPSKNTTSFR